MITSFCNNISGINIEHMNVSGMLPSGYIADLIINYDSLTTDQKIKYDAFVNIVGSYNKHSIIDCPFGLVCFRTTSNVVSGSTSVNWNNDLNSTQKMHIESVIELFEELNSQKINYLVYE